MKIKTVLDEVKSAMDAQVREEQGMQTFIERSRAIQSIEKMPGDASTRRYYRIKTRDGDQGLRTLVVMAMEPFEERGGSIPFLCIQKHLRRNGVDVPEVLDFDARQGFILLEDLGDTTLLRSLQDVADRAQERLFFEKAIDAVVNLHVATGPIHADEVEKNVIDGFKLRFDEEKLLWEVNFTIEHFYEKHLQRNITVQDRKIMNDGFKRICAELAAEPTVFTHRDYHSRNIMVTGSGRYAMIDFQDARMGPAQYDLASLLRDSYYQLDEAQIHHLTRYYMEQMKKRGAPVQDEARFDRLFDLMAVQRNFKAIGSFASFLNRRGNPAYLKFIGNTFENIRRNLLKYPEFSRLREVLYHYYYF
ncbi:MAG: phosphotransferase [Bdellovibrionales bacterium]|nr:phosphotransferase [Bdellovibrionales bacterium]